MEKRFMKGNEAIAEAAVRAGCRFFAGYPITPQSEVPEYLSWRLPEVGGDFVQAESEVAAINMVYGAACSGKAVMTSSSSTGVSLKAEGLSYLAQAKLPAVVVNVTRCGPGLGGILPAQSDYLMATKASGHGGFKMIVLAPSTVQETVDLMFKAFELAFRDRNPVMVMPDGVIGIMMESVTLPDFRELPVPEWAITGRKDGVCHEIIPMCWTGEDLERDNIEMGRMFDRWAKEDVMVEEYEMEDAEYVIAAYGTTARICKTVIRQARENNIKVGMIRPITVNPFPYRSFEKLNPDKVKKILTVEMTIPSQMKEDVRLGVHDQIPVETLGRSGGIVISPEEILKTILSWKGV
ncbi:3-methyl-2-oxobutanoate dehydrogenase subunit VorB [Hominifimenecus sp. rT4P-3]|uniref:3-methyl-2-oxobutanoate dehydrogenase subunit VorB n=1 Tax=Hominifimenecus sp. rT4P-3 TaxID=3242979 RepID=UPI003DA603B6